MPYNIIKAKLYPPGHFCLSQEVLFTEERGAAALKPQPQTLNYTDLSTAGSRQRIARRSEGGRYPGNQGDCRRRYAHSDNANQYGILNGRGAVFIPDERHGFLQVGLHIRSPLFL
jgi:hypothetical protein